MNPKSGCICHNYANCKCFFWMSSSPIQEVWWIWSSSAYATGHSCVLLFFSTVTSPIIVILINVNFRLENGICLYQNILSTLIFNYMCSLHWLTNSFGLRCQPSWQTSSSRCLHDLPLSVNCRLNKSPNVYWHLK